jgi:hypothetical protein
LSNIIKYIIEESPLEDFFNDTTGEPEPFKFTFKTVEYREKIAEKLIDYIVDRIMIVEKNGFKPKKVVLGEKEYDLLLAHYKNNLENKYMLFQGDEFPEKFYGLDIVTIPEKMYCKVVCNVEDEFLYKDRIREEK